MHDNEESFPISWLAQYGYCPRRCGLLALEDVWIENEETAAGRALHQRVHTERIERKKGQINLFELPVFSRTLGVNGKCDCVEAVESEDGIRIPYGDKKYQLYPVEYKHGRVRAEREYYVQLCAQAICLEEMFGSKIPRGAIFFINAHRRDEVILDENLRKETYKTAEAVRKLLEDNCVPPAVSGAKCKKCSLKEYCGPEIRHTAVGYCNKLWGIGEGEGKN